MRSTAPVDSVPDAAPGGCWSFATEISSVLDHSEMLLKLPTSLPHLPAPQREDLKHFILALPDSFGRHTISPPSYVLEHEIDVKNAATPIKQHAYHVDFHKRPLLVMVKKWTQMVELNLCSCQFVEFAGPSRSQIGSHHQI